MPEDFKAYSKTKIDNHLFNKYVWHNLIFLCPTFLMVSVEITLTLFMFFSFFHLSLNITSVIPFLRPRLHSPPVGGRENMPSHFKVKEYTPLVFRNLRERFGVEDGEYLNSICKAEPIPTDSPGRSNSQFWMTYDRRFVVKTVASEEIEQLHHILKDYHQVGF